MKVEVVQTAAGLVQAQNLRYEVYTEEMKLYGERADSRGRRLQDEHDETGIQLLGTVDGKPAGTARVHAGPLPEAWCRDLDAGALAGMIPPERMAFGSGLTVLPEYRGSPLVLKLINGVVEQAIRVGCEVLLLDCVPHLISLYQRLGWRRYTRKIVQDPATGALIPMALVLHDQEHLAQVRSSLAAPEGGETLLPRRALRAGDGRRRAPPRGGVAPGGGRADARAERDGF